MFIPNPYSDLMKQGLVFLLYRWGHRGTERDWQPWDLSLHSLAPKSVLLASLLYCLIKQTKKLKGINSYSCLQNVFFSLSQYWNCSEFSPLTCSLFGRIWVTPCVRELGLVRQTKESERSLTKIPVEDGRCPEMQNRSW